MRNDQLLAFIDFETTGLNYQTDIPIEIGIILTDHNLNKLKVYESLIVWDVFYTYGDEWPRWSIPAYEVHKITLSNIKDNGKHVRIVQNDIINICNEFSTGRKPVIVSDCSNFEMDFMRVLFNQSDYRFPFHHCCWDSSLLLELSGVGDPQNVPHRALADITLVYESVSKAHQIIKRGLL